MWFCTKIIENIFFSQVLQPVQGPGRQGLLQLLQVQQDLLIVLLPPGWQQLLLRPGRREGPLPHLLLPNGQEEVHHGVGGWGKDFFVSYKSKFGFLFWNLVSSILYFPPCFFSKVQNNGLHGIVVTKACFLQFPLSHSSLLSTILTIMGSTGFPNRLFGSLVSLAGVLSHPLKEYDLRMCTKAILISRRANRIPMQLRGPCPKAM